MILGILSIEFRPSLLISTKPKSADGIKIADISEDRVYVVSAYNITLRDSK